MPSRFWSSLTFQNEKSPTKIEKHTSLRSGGGASKMNFTVDGDKGPLGFVVDLDYLLPRIQRRKRTRGERKLKLDAPTLALRARSREITSLGFPCERTTTSHTAGICQVRWIPALPQRVKTAFGETNVDRIEDLDSFNAWFALR